MPCNRMTVVVAALAAFAVACGGGTTSETDGGTDAGTGSASVLAGTFQAMLVPPVPASGGQPETPGFTTFVGKVYTGATPSQLVWELAQTAGDCRLVTPRVPFCNTSCGGSAVCVENDTCQPYPSARSVGTVKVTGMRTSTGATEVSMTPIANGYQPSGTVELAYPAFSEGDDVRLEASGDAYPAFSLSAKGIRPLQLTSTSLTLERNKALTVTWTAPGQAGLAKAYVKLDISHHGGTRGMIECETADTGSLQLTADLITRLLDLGVAGFPTIILSRKAIGSTVIAPGRVELVLASEVEQPVIIPGLASCSEDTECPSGKPCRPDLTCTP